MKKKFRGSSGISVAFTLSLLILFSACNGQKIKCPVAMERVTQASEENCLNITMEIPKGWKAEASSRTGINVKDPAHEEFALDSNILVYYSPHSNGVVKLFDGDTDPIKQQVQDDWLLLSPDFECSDFTFREYNIQNRQVVVMTYMLAGSEFSGGKAVCFCEDIPYEVSVDVSNTKDSQIIEVLPWVAASLEVEEKLPKEFYYTQPTPCPMVLETMTQASEGAHIEVTFEAPQGWIAGVLGDTAIYVSKDGAVCGDREDSWIKVEYMPHSDGLKDLFGGDKSENRVLLGRTGKLYRELNAQDGVLVIPKYEYHLIDGRRFVSVWEPITRYKEDGTQVDDLYVRCFCEDIPYVVSTKVSDYETSPLTDTLPWIAASLDVKENSAAVLG